MVQTRDYVISRAFGRLRMRAAFPRFKAQAEHIRDIDEALEFVFSFREWGISISPFQNRKEIGMLTHKVAEISPSHVAEIGTGWGGTLFLLCTASSPTATLASIDLPPSTLGRGYPRWKEPLYKSFARNQQKVTLIRGNSHDAKTVASLRGAMEGNKLDAIFIDGDHSYEGVKTDFRLYSPCVRAGGIIALHDIVPNISNEEVEVFKFWKEIKHSYKSEEFVFEHDKLGIGVIRV